jgi:hypothetical protein
LIQNAAHCGVSISFNVALWPVPEFGPSHGIQNLFDQHAHIAKANAPAVKL